MVKGIDIERGRGRVGSLMGEDVFLMSHTFLCHC